MVNISYFRRKIQLYQYEKNNNFIRKIERQKKADRKIEQWDRDTVYLNR